MPTKPLRPAKRRPRSTPKRKCTAVVHRMVVRGRQVPVLCGATPTVKHGQCATHVAAATARAVERRAARASNPARQQTKALPKKRKGRIRVALQRAGK